MVPVEEIGEFLPLLPTQVFVQFLDGELVPERQGQVRCQMLKFEILIVFHPRVFGFRHLFQLFLREFTQGLPIPLHGADDDAGGADGQVRTALHSPHPLRTPVL